MRNRVRAGLLAALLTLTSGCGVPPSAPAHTAEIPADTQQAAATPSAAPTATQMAATAQPTHTPAPSDLPAGTPAPSEAPETGGETPAPTDASTDTPAPAPADTPEPTPESTPEPAVETVPAPTLPPIETRLGWDEGAGLSLRLGMSREDLIWQLAVQGMAYTVLPDSVTVSARWNGAILPIWMTATDDAPLTEVSTVLTDLGDDPLGTLDALVLRLTGFYGAPSEDGWTALAAGLTERTRAALSAALAAEGRCAVRWEAYGEQALLTLSAGYEEKILAELSFSRAEHAETPQERSPFAAEIGF